MKILGISGSPRKKKISNVYKLVKIVLESTGIDYELVSLRGKDISGCMACLACASNNICKLNDDMKDLRSKIVEADAYVIGAPNYYSGINSITHSFLERWYQFRHNEGQFLWGKLAVAVGVGGTSGSAVTDQIKKFLYYNFIEPVAEVTGIGPASCYSCGYGESCKVGIPYFIHGEGVKITDDIIPDISKQPDVIENAKKAGELLGNRLKNNWDRKEVTLKMQQKMMQLFKEGS